MTPPQTQMKTFADAEVVLASKLPGYASRRPQQQLAEAIEASLVSKRNLLAEAPTATGKSFASLIPAILSGQKVIFATATKALQTQVAEKDLPFLAEHLGHPFTFAVLKGKSNYLCQEAMTSPDAQDVEDIARVIAASTEEGFDGTQDGLGFEISGRDWSKLTVTSEECPGKKNCPSGETCFAERAKERAAQADVVVVNHALLMVDLVIRHKTAGNASMLGAYDAVIIDEVHELPEYATGAFTNSLSQGTILALSRECDRFAESHGMEEAIQGLPEQMTEAMHSLWMATRVEDGKQVKSLEDGRLRASHVASFSDEWITLANAAYDFYDGFKNAPILINDTETDRTRKYALNARLKALSALLVDLITVDDAQSVRWVETTENRNGEIQRINIAPIEIGPILDEILFSQPEPVIGISATLATNGNFDYISDRLGVYDHDSLIVDSPFNYPKQARLYIPGKEFPAPAKKTREEWEIMVVEEMLQLIKASEGSALLLFTSTKQMRAAREQIEHRIPYNVFMQGEEPNKVLADKFRADESSVLFATRSFFTGVDFAGDTLRLVIMDKLTFPVPTDPMVEALSELIKNRGGNDFREFVIPSMSLTLAQGFGRLIRSIADYGVVAILDSRLSTAGYAKQILRSLPNAPITNSLQEIRDFLADPLAEPF